MKTWLVAVVTVGILLGAAEGLRRSQPPHAEFPGTPELIVSENQPASVNGAPVTAVVVTQCNLLLAAYLTMPNGELVRFDQNSGLPWATVLDMANTAARSERIEVSCNSEGVEGYENKTAPVSLTFM